MKMFRYIFISLVMVAVVACDRGDDSDTDVQLPDGPVFDETTAYGARMKKFYDDYGVWCRYNVPAEDLYYTWTGSENWSTNDLSYEYEDADPNYIVQAVDFLENEVMENIPKEILDKYMGLCIAFEGRIFHSFNLDDGLNYSQKEDYPGLVDNYEEAEYGWNASRYLMLAPVGPEFDRTDKELLKRKWTKMIIFKAMGNLPNPEDFEKYNTEAWSAFAYFYADYLVGDHETGWAYNEYIQKYQGPYTDGLVSPGPLASVSLMDGYDDDMNQTGFYAMIYKWYKASSCLDAFAEYVAYIMYASAEEKAEIRAQSDKIRVNEGLVKEYCKQYLNWDIPELGGRDN